MPLTSQAIEKIELAPHVSDANYGYVSSKNGRDFLFLTGFEQCSPDYDLRRDTFPYLILEMIIGGSGTLQLGSDFHSIEAGSCFCSGFNTPLRLRSSAEDPLRKFFIAFASGSLSRRLTTSLLYPGIRYKCPDPSLLEKWSQLILEECASQDEEAAENTVSLVNILLRKIAPFAENASPAPRADALVLKAIRQIENNFQQIRSIQELAENLHVTREHLCRAFKKAGRPSPYKILSRRKMEHAYAQLKLSHLSIQDIALKLGFTDAFHFSRAFKKHYGRPPSQLRES